MPLLQEARSGRSAASEQVLLYTVFHLNLAYSSIEETQRPTVIERCYWPLLRLARQFDLPLGIEASGHTLETIAALDPTWVGELRQLVTDGPCEFIGCGYAQIIGPLVPAAVNAANLRLGMEVYVRLLGFQPRVALINEQAYAAGLISHYLAAGYEAIVMEWDNPSRGHPEWAPEWRYLPQYACGTGGEGIPLIWNKSIAFQKFQRYVHGEMELDEYLGYIRNHMGEQPRAFPLYGNDVEVFDFRPGRFLTEAPLHGEGEWQRIAALFAALLAEPGLQFIRPGQVLDLLDQRGAGQHLHLESAAQPVPVKKQGKYNLLRWAVTGRADLGINTRCWQIYAAMQASGQATDGDWRELCYLWSSDFRTHITDARWAGYRQRLDAFTTTWLPEPAAAAPEVPVKRHLPVSTMRVERHGRYLAVHGARLSASFNCQRGLALESLVDRACSAQPLYGTLHHGYYDDIQWGADYYTGHLVFESPGRPKVTDLNPVEPSVTPMEGGVMVTATVPTLLGPVEKCWRVDDAQGRLTLSYRIAWEQAGVGSLRLGHITLMPEAFDESSLYYRTHNGGQQMETFTLSGAEVDHGRAVSFLVSTSQAIGITGGVVELGDAHHCLRVEVDKTQAALVGLLTHQRVRERYFCRLVFSAWEVDDTSRGGEADVQDFRFALTIRTEGGK